jgi:4-amino-4-deoxy-L-arabinose transferase-like glycosyltransferase
LNAGRFRSDLLPFLLLLAVIALGAVFFVGDLGEGTFQPWDAFYTFLRSRNILESGDWLTIHYNFEPSFKKPPLQYWLTALLLSAGWEPTFALRIWPFVFGICVLVLTGVVARTIAPGRPWAAPSAVMLAAASPMFWVHAQQGMLDTGQAFFLLATLGAALLAARDSRWWLLAGAAVGLGFLQKTPVALLALTLWVGTQQRLDPAGVYAWQQLRNDRWFRWAAVIALVLCVLWPLVQVLRHGGDFLDVFFYQEMASRFSPLPEKRHGTFPGSTVQWLGWLRDDAAHVWLPSLLVLPVVLCSRRFRDDPRLRGLAWLIVACCLFLAAAGGKTSPRYLLVVLPVLSIVSAVALTTLFSRPLVAPLLCAVLLGANLPALLEAPAFARRFDYREERRVSELFREILRPGEQPVFIRIGKQGEFPDSAFSYFSDVDRHVIFVRPKHISEVLPELDSRPYLGLTHRIHTRQLTRAIGPLHVVGETENYVIWR